MRMTKRRLQVRNAPAATAIQARTGDHQPRRSLSLLDRNAPITTG
jgi:hypothetical protein